MSEKQEPAKKTGKGKKIFLIGAGVVALGGGSAAAALYATTGSLTGGGGHEAPDPNLPHLVVRPGVSESEAARYFSRTGEKKVDGSKFQPTYHPVADTLTANLSGEGFVQIGLGVATYYDERVVENVKLHDMAIRSAVLTTLADQDAAGLATAEGKAKLKATLRTAINDVLKAKEGFGGIDDVYFTSFVIQ